LKARGHVTLQPHKRPKSSWIRLEADLPIERWQSDMTHVIGADGKVFEVLTHVSPMSRDITMAPPASRNANLEPLVEGPAITLAARHAKVRREGYVK